MKTAPGSGKKVRLIGAPLGFAAGKPGSELGVEAMRLASFHGKNLIDQIRELGYDVRDGGDVSIKRPAGADETGPEPKYLEETVISCENIAAAVESSIENGEIPIILGGDHSIAIGSVSGLASYFRKQDQQFGLIWFDAHADINTPQTTMSGNIHGMPLAALLGRGDERLAGIGGFSPKIDGRYLAHVGARDVDGGEKNNIHSWGLSDQFFTMSDIDKRGMLACVNDAIDIASAAPGGFAVTFDVDMIDPRFAPGSGTLVRGGTTYREAHLALETIAERGGMRSFEIVEVNPMLDQSNITVELACELILSALGKTIL
ncbi:MAG TPA: arginase [Pyrinomonadaceae bacterium]|nr:arginase [Pyrinomonadaceae bacterium]